MKQLGSSRSSAPAGAETIEAARHIRGPSMETPWAAATTMTTPRQVEKKAPRGKPVGARKRQIVEVGKAGSLHPGESSLMFDYCDL